MAIIFPAKCRGVTAGALRQIKQDGHTTACGGLWDAQSVQAQVALDPDIYFRKTEPTGQFMETLERTKQQIYENTDAITNASAKLVDTAKAANKQIADVTGKFRDGTERLGTAIDKLMKVAGRGDFAETVKLTEALVTSLERLAILEEKGVLDKVMRAMKQ